MPETAKLVIPSIQSDLYELPLLQELLVSRMPLTIHLVRESLQNLSTASLARLSVGQAKFDCSNLVPAQ
jgi:hypothetical protein